MYVYRWMDRWIHGYVHTTQRLHTYVNTIQRSWYQDLRLFHVTHAHPPAHTHAHTHAQIYSCTYECIHPHAQPHKHSRVSVCVRERVCICAWVRVWGRKREYLFVWEGERVFEREVCACAWMKSVRACVCVGGRVGKRERVCVCNREGVRVCVYVSVWRWVCVLVCLGERKRERERECVWGCVCMKERSVWER